MADPRQPIPTITYEEVANANAQIAMVTSPASRRALRSTTGATSATSSPAEKLPTPALPGKKSTKQILFAQIGDVEPLQQSTQPTTQATQMALPWLKKLPTCPRHVTATAKCQHIWPKCPCCGDTKLIPTFFCVSVFADIHQIFL